MSKTRRIFISDIHLSAHENGWFKMDAHRDALIFALDSMINQCSDIKELVLLGDIFDTWVARVDEYPKNIFDIADANQVIIQKLAECAKYFKVFYINGNHDHNVDSNQLSKIIPGAQWITRYHSGMIYGEHGNRFAMFNADDKIHDPKDGFPLGYYITRMVTGTKTQYDSPEEILKYIDDILEAAFTSQQLAESVVEAVAEAANLPLGTKIMMPEGRTNLTIKDVMLRYSRLFDRWTEKFGYRYALNALQAELGSLGWFADRLCRKEGYKVVIMGHTHKPLLDRDTPFFGQDRVYANSGRWCTDNPTFIDVNKTQDIKITLFQVQKNIENLELKQIKTETIT